VVGIHLGAHLFGTSSVDAPQCTILETKQVERNSAIYFTPNKKNLSKFIVELFWIIWEGNCNHFWGKNIEDLLINEK